MCMWGFFHSGSFALSSPGCFPSLCHNEIRDLTATLLTAVCNDIQVEPDLQEISMEAKIRCTANTTEGTRLDVAASGVWGEQHKSVHGC